MVETHMYFAMGFLLAAVSLVVFIPLVHGRAVRLTRQQLQALLPASTAEVAAGKDLLRAEFAMTTRQLEIEIGALKAKVASGQAEIGRKTDAVLRLTNELNTMRGRLTAADDNAARNPQDQTVTADAGGATPSPAHADGEELLSLRMQVESLTKWLTDAGVEIRAMRAEQEELEGARETLAEERLKFRNFHRRAAELVQQLINQAANDRGAAAGSPEPDARTGHQAVSGSQPRFIEKPAA